MKAIVRKENIIPFLLAIVFAVMMAAGSVPASASELEANGIERSRPASITMTVNQDEWYVDGSTFRLYKVADLTDDMTFSYVDAFKECGVDVSLSPNAAWMDTAAELIKYVQDSGIKETASAKIHNRTMTFSGLDLGLYLVQGDTASEGNRTVTYQPVVISVPQRNSAADSWTYDVTSHVKSADAKTTTETPSTETPSKPATPSRPGTSSKTKTSSGTAKKTSGKKVKTGDTSRTRFYLTVILVDAAAIGAILILRKRSRRSS